MHVFKVVAESEKDKERVCQRGFDVINGTIFFLIGGLMESQLTYVGIAANHLTFGIVVGCFSLPYTCNVMWEGGCQHLTCSYPKNGLLELLVYRYQ